MIRVDKRSLPAPGVRLPDAAFLRFAEAVPSQPVVAGTPEYPATLPADHCLPGHRQRRAGAARSACPASGSSAPSGRRSTHDSHRRFGIGSLLAETGCDNRDTNSVRHFRIDNRTHNDRCIFRRVLLDRVADFLELADRQVHSGGDVDQDAVAPLRLMSSSSGLDAAASAASRARSSPDATPEPIIAMPISDMTVRTSAKSTLIRPGRVISSAIPCTAPCSTWFADTECIQQRRLATQNRQQLSRSEW